MGASVGVGGLIVGTSMLVVLALAVNAIDLRLESSLETIESANEPIPAFTIDNADLALGAVMIIQIDDGVTGYIYCRCKRNNNLCGNHQPRGLLVRPRYCNRRPTTNRRKW